MSDDQGNDRSPRLVTGRNGRRLFSMAALSERVREEFLLEYAGTPALSEADTSSQRMRLVLGVVDYVIAVESLAMGSDDKAVLIQRVYSELFGYGALDPFFADASVTTIALNGTDHVAVRYGSQDLQELGAIFDPKKGVAGIHWVASARRQIREALAGREAEDARRQEHTLESRRSGRRSTLS